MEDINTRPKVTVMYTQNQGIKDLTVPCVKHFQKDSSEISLQIKTLKVLKTTFCFVLFVCYGSNVTGGKFIQFPNKT